MTADAVRLHLEYQRDRLGELERLVREQLTVSEELRKELERVEKYLAERRKRL